METIDRYLTQASADGYSGPRIIADMAWALGDPPGVEHLTWYEAQVNRSFLDGRAMGVCLYARRRFEASLLRRIASAHPGTKPAQPDGTWVPPLRLRRTSAGTLQLVGAADATNRYALSAALGVRPR